MILDSFKSISIIFQIVFDERFEVWDHSGAIARRLILVWPGLGVTEANPYEQKMTAKDGASTTTGIKICSVTLQRGRKLDDSTIDQLAKTFDIWRSELRIEKLSRISCRWKFAKEFNDRRAANAEVAGWGLCKLSEEKVFDQPQDGEGNVAQVELRFEDLASFAVLRAGSEHFNMEYNPHPEADDEPWKKTKHRAYIDFDRGNLGEIDATSLRVDEWLKGYRHLLRRDIGKLIPRG